MFRLIKNWFQHVAVAAQYSILLGAVYAVLQEAAEHFDNPGEADRVQAPGEAGDCSGSDRPSFSVAVMNIMGLAPLPKVGFTFSGIRCRLELHRFFSLSSFLIRWRPVGGRGAAASKDCLERCPKRDGPFAKCT